MRLTALTILLCICLTEGISAQTKFSAGFRVGASFTSMNLSGEVRGPIYPIDRWESFNGPGSGVMGLKVSYYLGERPHIQNWLSFEILFDRADLIASRKILTNGQFLVQDLHILTSYIKFPIIFEFKPKWVQWHVGTGLISLIGAGGITTNIRLTPSATFSVADTAVASYNTRISLRRFDFGYTGNIGGEYKWNNGISFYMDMGFETGLINLNSDPSIAVHSESVCFTTGMMFPL